MPWTKPYLHAKNQRLNLTLYTETNRITYFTIRAYLNQKPFLKDEICRMIIETLGAEQTRLGCLVYTYCLMPDHLHYLIRPKQDGNVLKFTD